MTVWQAALSNHAGLPERHDQLATGVRRTCILIECHVGGRPVSARSVRTDVLDGQSFPQNFLIAAKAGVLNDLSGISTNTVFVHFIAQLSHASSHLMNRHQTQNWA